MNKNPYTKDSGQFVISRQERVAYKNAFSKYLKTYQPQFSFKTAINDAKTFDDLKVIVSKLEIPLLMNILTSRLLEFSSHDMQQFVQYFDDTLNLVSCLEEEISPNLLNSQDNKFNNNALKNFDFNIDFDLNFNFKFDFFKIFRDKLFQKLEFITVRFVCSILFELLPYIDSDRINRCTVPCEKDRNPYKNQFTKAVLKTGINTTIFLQQKIKENNLSISDEELQIFVKRALQTLSTDEIDCLLNGFLSSNILELLKDLFDELFDGDNSVVPSLLENLDNVVDIVPGTDTLSPTSPCGDLHVESLQRAIFEKQGLSENEINLKINEILSSNIQKLQTIGKILQNSTFDLSLDLEEDSENPLKNADLTISIINKSVDTIFDSLGKNYFNAMRKILETILLSPVGEMCLAFYGSNIPQINFNISPNIKTYIDSQMNEQVGFSDNPLALVFSSNFHEKYRDFFISSNTVDQFFYLENRVVMSVNGQVRIIVERDKIIFNINNSNVQIPLSLNEELMQFSNNYDRQSGFIAMVAEKNNPILSNIQFNPNILMQNTFNSMKQFLQKDMGSNFFFSEFNSLPLIKRKFIDSNLLDLEIEKERIKTEING